MDVGWDIFRGICTRENFSPSISGTSSFGLISHSVLVKKERKNNLKTLNHAWEYLIWWQFVAVRSMSCYCCRFAPLHIYIYIWNKTRTIDLFFIFNNLFESSKTCWSYYENIVLLSYYNRFFVFTLNILCFKMKWKGICFTKVLYSQL